MRVAYLIVPDGTVIHDSWSPAVLTEGSYLPGIRKSSISFYIVEENSRPRDHRSVTLFEMRYSIRAKAVVIPPFGGRPAVSFKLDLAKDPQAQQTVLRSIGAIVDDTRDRSEDITLSSDVFTAFEQALVSQNIRTTRPQDTFE